MYDIKFVFDGHITRMANKNILYIVLKEFTTEKANYFYKYEAPRPSEEIMAEIMELEKELTGSLEEVFR